MSPLLALLAAQIPLGARPSAVPAALTRDQVAFAFRVQDPKVDVPGECARLAKSRLDLDRQFAAYLTARGNHRQYELKVKDTRGGKEFLRRSVIDRYQDYVRRYPKGAVVYEARFYLAMAFLEAGDLRMAQETVDERDFRPSPGTRLFVDDLVWTPGREFAMDRALDASALRAQLDGAMDAHQRDPFADVRTEGVARALRAWARSSGKQAGS